MKAKHVLIEITFNASSSTVFLRKLDERGLQTQHVTRKRNRPSRWEEAALLSRLGSAIDAVLRTDQSELF